MDERYCYFCTYRHWSEDCPDRPGRGIPKCPGCQRVYEAHPFIGVLTCFVHPSQAEQDWYKRKTPA